MLISSLSCMFHSSLLIYLITFYLHQSCGLHWKISVAEPVSVFPLLCWLVLHSMTFTMYFNELLASYFVSQRLAFALLWPDRNMLPAFFYLRNEIKCYWRWILTFWIQDCQERGSDQEKSFHSFHSEFMFSFYSLLFWWMVFQPDLNSPPPQTWLPQFPELKKCDRILIWLIQTDLAALLCHSYAFYILETD